MIITILTGCSKQNDNDPLMNEGFIIDHSSVKLSSIPSEWILAAKENLHIAYSHTSHGSQLTEGMSGLISFKGEVFSWNNGGTGGSPDLRDGEIPLFELLGQ